MTGLKGYMESLAEIRHRIETGGPKSRSTVYKGITFRSRLEARFAMHLDELGERWRYEPRPYGRKGTGYLPDFEIVSAPLPTFIEVKPTLEEVPAAQQKMSVIWDVHPDAILIVACEEGATYFSNVLGEAWVRWQERWAA